MGKYILKSLKALIASFLLIQINTTYSAEPKPSVQNSLSSTVTQTLCHPEISPDKSQYIIGYGSLMEESSKKRTAPNSGVNYPIRIKNFERGWKIQGTAHGGNAYLAVTPKTGAQLNAVIYNVNTKELDATDQREKGYCRVEVPKENIASKWDKAPADKQIWIYIVPESQNKQPSKEYPIAQTYVDTWIKGCMDLESKYSIKGFARECVSTTSNWSNFWLNDRSSPRYPSALLNIETDRIDQLLNQLVHDHFQKRRTI